MKSQVSLEVEKESRRVRTRELASLETLKKPLLALKMEGDHEPRLIVSRSWKMRENVLPWIPERM